MDVEARRIRLAALFFIPGLGIASWVSRTPSIRDALDASTAEMGWILFGLSGGSMVGILLSAALVRRAGARTVIAGSSVLIVVGLAVIGGGSAVATALLVAAGLFLFGLGMGSAEVALNIEGAVVEQDLGRPLLPLLHGFFSVGAFAGAVAGIGFSGTEMPVAIHLGAVAAISSVLLVVAIGSVSPVTGRADRTGDRAARERPNVRQLLRGPGTALAVATVLAMALAEGTANDWLPLLMVDGHGFAATSGSAIYAGFVGIMAAVRLAGGQLVGRFGRTNMLRASAAFAAAGLAMVSLAEQPVVAVAGAVVWALGVALGFPLVLSAAADSGEDSAAQVSLVATAGYVAFLVGPPVLGLLGEHVSLRSALSLPLVAALVAVAATTRMGAGGSTTTVVDGEATRTSQRR